MKLKLVIVDLELSTRQRRGAAAVAAVVSLLGGGSVAIASVPHAFVSGDNLTAVALNENFAALDARIAAGESDVSDLDARLTALEGAPMLTELAYFEVLPGATYYSDCVNDTGTFSQGACARVATYYCTDQGFVSGWLDGDIGAGGQVALWCIK